VFNRYKKILFSYTFPSVISIKPQYFKTGKRDHLFVVVDDSSQKIYLFNKKGEEVISSGLAGITPVLIGSLKNNGDQNLVSLQGDMVYNYRIK